MTVLGHGIDLVDVEEIAALLKLSDDFLNRCFSNAERERLLEIVANAERIAARFAVKEAVLKALGRGFGNGFSFQDVEVFNHQSGAPFVVLHGRVRELSDSLGVSNWLVSLSHDGGKAIASVIAT
ncbi:holo-ACP synthase [Sinorhizobium fredii]|uniref:Holo-[acyl-carrier-protein] synthase n=1 Tax=Rhizobium fredii TaxID=380 RepID=A0A2L0HA43_RHIFR|nr:holo-ACP synthase [Sinorhizobium fredii]AUX78314.1 holo-(acyl-carrier-protein) synthase 2 [Sinorhizobium fredii]